MKNIATAFVKAKKDFSPAMKTATNPYFKSKYADLAACVEAVDDSFLANGIVMYQETSEDTAGVTVETVLLHESGESIRCGKLHIPALKQDAQAFGSALSYARRYSLMAACGIAPEDDDGNAASEKGKKTTTKKEDPPPPPTPPPPPKDEAPKAQREKLFELCMKRWDSRDKSKAFAAYLLEMAGMEAFTKQYISECINDFEARAKDFEEL